ncbi:MAG: ATP-binding protein [Candidatus Blackburnbacteria bacterium]|nr:ATP-binding protein [Candidatus Blackburnbacteria bacterium]
MLPERCRKIALVGTSCVGKTTILEALQKKYADCPDIGFVPEAARNFFERNPGIDRFTKETQAKIQTFAIEQEHKINGIPNVIVCDRSPLDAAAYTRAAGDFEGAGELVASVLYWMPTYEVLLLLNPADVPYQNDHVRSEDANFRQQVHDAFVHILEENKIPYMLLCGTFEERLKQIDVLIREFQNL